MAFEIRHTMTSSVPDSYEALREMLASLEAQVVSLYEEKERAGSSQGAADEALTALYEDKLRLSARVAAELRESVKSMSAQLHSLYEEREHALAADLQATEMVCSLEQQVAALLDERNDLAAELEESRLDVQRAKVRARELVNAIVDRSFA